MIETEDGGVGVDDGETRETELGEGKFQNPSPVTTEMGVGVIQIAEAIGKGKNIKDRNWNESRLRKNGTRKKNSKLELK